MSRKKRVLFLTEAAYLSTGYATYSRNVLSHMQKTGKYDLAEISVYGNADDPRRESIPWKNYPVLPDSTATEQEKQVYNSNHGNVFGAWRFERACLDFKPDIVLTIRDFWMDSFVYESPYRRLFKWIWMPTVDAAPQNEEWIHQFADADAVLTYSDWAKEVIDNQSGGGVNTIGSASPSASEEFSMITDKAAAKAAMGIPADYKIIGTVMRNQRRKLFPVLFEAFSKYIHKTGDTKTYLHCHTSYPDGGWDFGELLHSHNISSRVLFTYVCSDPQCKAVEICKFNDSRKSCSSCKKFTSTQTHVNNGVSDDILSKIYNTHDLYIQCANCEGFGLPQVEAAACGVPVACTNYSAMEDVVKKLPAYPIEVEALYKELETGCERAVPNVDSIVKIFEDFFSKSFIEQNNLRIKTRETFEKVYGWDKTAKVWMDIIDSLDYADWNTPPIIKPAVDVPTNEKEGNVDFLRKCANAYLMDPNRIHSHVMRVFLRDLNAGSFKPPADGMWGSEFSPFTNRTQNIPFTRDKVVEILKAKLNTSNAWEQARTNPEMLTDTGAKWLN
jgi:glycosyltransferase involved in cell wall biosynthesis